MNVPMLQVNIIFSPTYSQCMQQNYQIEPLTYSDHMAPDLLLLCDVDSKICFTKGGFILFIIFWNVNNLLIKSAYEYSYLCD